MTETKWTPGPWENQGEDYFADMPFIRIGVGGRLIGEALPPIGADAIENEMRANANLMTASPDLYAALKETLEIAARNESGDYIERANAAMRKARGE